VPPEEAKIADDDDDDVDAIVLLCEEKSGLSSGYLATPLRESATQETSAAHS
jgi:hypothetical protein